MLSIIAISLVGIFCILSYKSYHSIYPTWGFNKSEKYVEDKEFVMPRTSWSCKSKYLILGYEFWWSPGGGFSSRKYINNALLILLSIGLAYFFPAFVIAVLSVTIVLFLFLTMVL